MHVCLGCGLEMDGEAAGCPRCPGTVVSRRSAVRRGWVALVLGALLVVGITAVGVLIASNLAAFRGGPWALAFIYAVLALVLSIGVVAFLAGRQLVLHRRPNLRWRALAGRLYLGFLAVGLVARGIAAFGS